MVVIAIDDCSLILPVVKIVEGVVEDRGIQAVHWVITMDLTVLVCRAKDERLYTRNGVTIRDRGGIGCADPNPLLDSFEKLFVPQGGRYLWVSGGSLAGLTARAILEPLGILAGPDVFHVPQVLDERLRAVHILLPVSDFKLDG